MASSADKPKPPGPDPAPRVLGRYELLTEIASGGMASVFLGRTRGVAGFERVVAVKVCHPHLRAEEEFAEMFLDEARLAAKIHHPNVVSTLDVGDDHDRLYLVMEYVEGDRLSGLIKAAGKRGQRIPPPVTARIFIDLLAGLHAAHELVDADGTALSVVHRDVSPQNVLVGVDGVARITDFGIARAQARITATGLEKIKGKLSYMAPEQFDGSGMTRRTDVYAAGVVLWETLTGKRLFRGDTDTETVRAVLTAEVKRPSEVAPGVDPGFDAVVLKAMARDPGQRFATAAAFAEAIEDLPLKVANARAVSTLVQELQGELLVARRDIVRRIGEGEPLIVSELTNPSAVRFARTELSLSIATSFPPPLPRESLAPPSLPEPPPAPAPTPAVELDLDLEPPPRDRRWMVVAVPLLLLVLVAGFAAASHQPSAPRRPTTIARVAPPPPVAPAPEPPLAPPVEALPPVEAPPPAEAAPEAAPPVAAPPAVRGVRAPAAVRRPPAHRPAAPGAPAAPTPEPPGEFRPGSI